MNRPGPRLRRSRENAVFGGVLGGLADHFGLDATRLRIVYVLLSIFSAAFPGILVYLALWYLLPREPEYPEPVEP